MREGKRVRVVVSAYREEKAWKAVSLSVVLLLTASVLPHTADADQVAWTPEVLDSGPASQPVLLVDGRDQVHTLWVHNFSLDEDAGPDAVFYARRGRAGIWTHPVDVLVPPRGEGINYPAAVIDAQDRIHLIANLVDGLYCSSARASSADRAMSWSEFRPISRAQTGPSGIALGPGGTIHVVYPEIHTPTAAVYYISSIDEGLTWSRRQTVSAPDHSEAVAMNAQIAVASSGRLHVVWTETIELFPPSGVFYAFSDDGGQSWSAPQMMAGRGYNWISIGLEADDSRVHLIWTGTGDVIGKYHAMSSDGGLSWSEPEMIFYGWAGYLGPSDFVLDSAGNLHLVTALGGSSERASEEWTGGEWHSRGDIFHSTWQGDRWDMPEHVSVALWEPQLEQAVPSVVISEGNLLHIAWSGTYHPEAKRKPVWYTARRLEAPRVEVRNLPALAPSPMPSPEPSVVPTKGPDKATTPVAEEAGRYALPLDDFRADDQPINAVVVGVAPAVLIVLGVVGVVAFRRMSRG